MRHLKKGRKLNRTASHKRALLRNMITSFLMKESIKSTDSKIKALKPLADKMITLGKKGDLHVRRQALAVIKDKSVVNKLFDEIAPRMASRNGGYTRIIKVGQRKGDAAYISLLELIDASSTGETKVGKQSLRERLRPGRRRAKAEESKTEETEAPAAEVVPEETKQEAKAPPE